MIMPRQDRTAAMLAACDDQILRRDRLATLHPELFFSSTLNGWIVAWTDAKGEHHEQTAVRLRDLLDRLERTLRKASAGRRSKPANPAPLRGGGRR